MHVPGWWAGAAADAATGAVTGIPAWVSDIGAPGLLALTIVLILTGQLVPARSVRRIEADRDRYQKAGEVKDQTIKELAEGGRISQDVMRALEKLASQKDAAP